MLTLTTQYLKVVSVNTLPLLFYVWSTYVYCKQELREFNMQGDDEGSTDESIDGELNISERDLGSPLEPPLSETPYMENIVSRDPQDGAKSAEDSYRDDVSLEAADGRSQTETYFHPDNAPSDKIALYRRLYRIQEGVRVNDGERRGRNREVDRKRDAETVMSQLRMPSGQQDRVETILKDYDINGIRAEKVIFAVISLVCNENNRRVREEDRWNELRESFNINSDELRVIRSKVQKESQYL